LERVQHASPWHRDIREVQTATHSWFALHPDLVNVGDRFLSSFWNSQATRTLNRAANPPSIAGPSWAE
jgi:hypothetical protein